PKHFVDADVVARRYGGFLRHHYASLYKGHARVTWSQYHKFSKFHLESLDGFTELTGRTYSKRQRVNNNRLNLVKRRRVYYLHVSVFWIFMFKIYSIIFDVTYAYCLFWFFCYKQILFVFFSFILLRLYFYGIQVSFYEYRYMLLEYKNFLIF